MKWQSVPASELILKRGGSVNPAKFPDEIFDLLSIPAFDRGYVDVLAGSEIGSSKSLVKPNDVLLSKIIPHIRRCWVVPEKNQRKQIGSGEWIIFRDERFHSPFLKHWLTSDLFHRQFMNTVAGVGGSLVRARPAFVEKIIIPLPPLKEQKRIAAILDKADAIRRKRQQAIELADQFLRSVFLDMFGDPLANPKGWKVKTLQDLSSKISSGTTPIGGSKVYVDEGVAFLRSQNVWRNKIVTDDLVYIDSATHSKMHKSSLKNKDLLMTKTGRFNTENSSLGRAAIFLGEDDTANINGHVYLMRLQDNVVHEFVLFILTTNEYREYIRSVCVGGIDKRQINKDHLQHFPIICPPLDIQHQFSEITRAIGAQNNLAKKSLKEFEDLFDSLSQKVFKGEALSVEAA